MRVVYKSLFFMLGVFFFLQCEKSTEDMPAPPTKVITVNFPDGKGFELLSEYNLFIGNIADLVPNDDAGVLPYDLNTALFSDYALKKRFVYVPEGKSIPFDTSGVLDLPTGSILVKHFYYTNPEGTDDYIETRLLLRKTDGWQAETYEWNDAQTDARRTVIGGTRQLSVYANNQNQTFNYLIPNQNQCRNCHALNGQVVPIGPAVPNLNKDYQYTDGTANQLDKWVERGILTNTSLATVPQWPLFQDASLDLNQRARAYLAVNCASCHRRAGSAANSGLYLEYENTDSLSLGFWKTPVAAGDGSGGLTYVISPGQADQSILLYRMISDEVNARMPEIGRELVHDEGINLIREWIDNME